MMISKRDKRAIILTVIIGGSILLHHYLLSPWFADWADVKAQIKSEQARLQKIDLQSVANKAKTVALNQIVPTFKKPVQSDKQRYLFQEKLNQQFNKLGIKPERMGFIGGKKIDKQSGYKVLKLQAKCKCDFPKAITLLAVLKENPYLVGIEAFDLKVNKKNRKQVDLILTLSTFAL